MERKELFEWAEKTYGTAPDYSWNDWNCVLRHKHNNKWYALVVELNEKKLGLTGDRIVDVLNIKCDPLLIGSLRMKPGFFPAYHMNKDKWISIIMPFLQLLEWLSSLSIRSQVPMESLQV